MTRTTRPEAIGPRKVAELMDVSEATVLRLIRAGKLPAVRMGRNWRISLEELEEHWLCDVQSLPAPVVSTPKSGVYFVRCGEFVKIGLTRDISQRFCGLSISNPEPLQLLHLIELDEGPQLAEVEWTLHERFKSSFHRGEWFRLDPEIRRYLIEECGVALP